LACVHGALSETEATVQKSVVSTPGRRCCLAKSKVRSADR
jgi:hypothetical protein